MGWAKYAEDNMEIFNNRMYDRGIGFPDRNVSDFKKDLIRSNLLERKEEYILVLEEIGKLDLWNVFIGKFKELASSQLILKLLETQKELVKKNKDNFIDYRYSQKFKLYWNEKFILGDSFLKNYEDRLKDSYLNYFIDKMSKFENRDMDDAIELDNIYMDLNKFIQDILEENLDSIKLPLVQYVREEVLGVKNKGMTACTNCNKETYIDFKTCIACKYPSEVV